jgi:hypothetical protein
VSYFFNEAPPDIRRYRYQVFLTTSSIGLWVQRLKFWSLPRIVGARAAGWAGFNWSVDLIFTGHRQQQASQEFPFTAESLYLIAQNVS